MRLFICYRRADTNAVAHRLASELPTLNKAIITEIDVDALPIGQDYRLEIERIISDCDAMLVLIGPRWLSRSGSVKPRIHEPHDPVRIEIRTAIANDIPIVPLLVDRRGIPESQRLPADISSLAFMNGLPLDSGADFRHHITRLVERLAGVATHDPANAVRPDDLHGGFWEPPTEPLPVVWRDPFAEKRSLRPAFFAVGAVAAAIFGGIAASELANVLQDGPIRFVVPIMVIATFLSVLGLMAASAWGFLKSNVLVSDTRLLRPSSETAYDPSEDEDS